MTLSKYVGDTRSNAIWRLVFLALNIATGFVLLGAIFTIGWLGAAVFMLANLAMGLVMDTDANTGESWAMRLWKWPVLIAEWTIFGQSDGDGFPWIP